MRALSLMAHPSQGRTKLAFNLEEAMRPGETRKWREKAKWTELPGDGESCEGISQFQNYDLPHHNSDTGSARNPLLSGKL